jgi:hypothetical protein
MFNVFDVFDVFDVLKNQFYIDFLNIKLILLYLKCDD